MESPAKQSLQPNRRKFLHHLAAGSLALTLPGLVHGKDRKPLPAPGNVLDESYWEMVKKQFTVPDNLVMLNAANLCPSPYFINERVYSLTRELESNVSFQFRENFTTQRAKALANLARFIGVSTEELGITRNTSEANITVVNGLDFKPGDEIVIWEQNHPSNGMAWEQRARRSALVIKKVSLPASPKSIDDLVSPFAKAITPKTKVIAFSHISNLSGMALPAKEICGLARAKGVMTLVDGAQTLGFMQLDLKAMGCDFFTASTHKWLMGPLENGVLYVRGEHIEKIWPNVIGGSWNKESKTVDEKLCNLGQRIETTTSALPETVDYHLTIGKQNIEERVKALNGYLKEQIQARVPKAAFVTPLSPDFSGGIVIIQIPGKDTKDIYQKLYERYGVACSPTGGIRLSPHIYNTRADIDKVVKGLEVLTA